MLRFVRSAAVALLFGAMPAAGHAQEWPTKPIQLYMGFPAGSGVDVVARMLQPSLEKTLGQRLVIDYKPGAGGNVASELVARAAPDGYTFLLGTAATHGVNAALYKKIPFDVEADFTPISTTNDVSNVLMVNPNVIDANSVQEFIAKVKAAPGKYNYASTGNGTGTHLAFAEFNHKAGLDMVHVPYKGGGHSSQAVIAGDVEMTFENPAVSLPFVQNGQLRALAVTNDTRNRQAPDIPTMIEAGVPDFVSVSFTGIVAPAGTPPAIVTQLNAAIVESMRSPEVQAALDKLGVDMRAGTPEAFATFLAHEREKWGMLIRAANIKAE